MSWLHFYFILKPPVAAKKQKGAANGCPKPSSPPWKHLGFAAQNPRKKSARALSFWKLSIFGGVFQPSSNPFWAKLLSKSRRLLARSASSPRQPRLLHFWDLPAEFLFWIWKKSGLAGRLPPSGRNGVGSGKIEVWVLMELSLITSGKRIALSNYCQA